ncbi:hypothetical protein SLEP1_g49916 [Rubroshorea leprosula]|uniref:Uncharacterized protein n=1 Tax=Rubroshorea leprosula TaxID=152421 RepID=A0AAV5M0U4_9ROSI|nr:hypothetical protein SLEP1_g49916 [Rubroshorea leprosula]
MDVELNLFLLFDSLYLQDKGHLGLWMSSVAKPDTSV